MLISLYDRIFRKDDLKMQQKKFRLAREAEADYSSRSYIYEKINGVTIRTDSLKEQNIIPLIEKKILTGWGYETTSLLTALFDEANLVRGDLELWVTEPYHHSWIEINIDGLVYCFDPCLNILCLKSDFNKIFNPTVKAKIPAKAIKDKLINYIVNDQNSGFVRGTDDITSEFYHMLAKVDGTVENNHIKSLNVKYYYN